MNAPAQPAPLWHLVGIAGTVIFFGRFYLQWIVSEIQKRSVVPVAFWYMSSIGSLLLLAYAVYLQSPVGAFSYAFNIIVYARNLVHIWRARGWLTRARSIALHAVVAVIVLAAMAVVAFIWRHEYEVTKTAPAGEMQKTWLWIFVGVAGQGLFACRFAVQWIATEREKKSVVPVAFWHLSLVATILMMLSYLERAEWLYAIGLAATIPVYVRNLWLIRRHRAAVA